MTLIDVLPDDILLVIFGFFQFGGKPFYYGVEAWHSLVHVCRRWRSLVFQSPRGLNLLLHCTPETPVMDNLDYVWPAALRLVIEVDVVFMEYSSITDNIIAALGKTDRVYIVQFCLTPLGFEEVSTAMQVQFPELTELLLSSPESSSISGKPVLPDTYLGGSAPCLRVVHLTRVSFPGLPKLLLSATHLVELDLCDVECSEYVSPEAVVASLSVLSSLKSFRLIFVWYDYPRHSSSLLPSKRTTTSTLPALVKFDFRGDSQYIEELLCLIETPQLAEIDILLFGLDDENQGDVAYERISQILDCIPTLKRCAIAG